MNSLIIFKEELSGNIATITGTHFRYINELHDLKLGRILPVNLLNGDCGRGEIIELNEDSLKVSFKPERASLPLNPITLIVAVPRPQTQKKIIHLASSLGLKELHFVRCINSEKSYLSSKSLSEEGIKWEVIKGLEQSGESIAVTVKVHDRFKIFIEDIFPKLVKEPCQKIIFDTVPVIAEDRGTRPADTVLAFGPEAGWSDYERERFNELGFKTESLGSRILRCETAVALALGRFVK
jgi:RsmE family RNA methyltransferase